jgi:hypothetical protein
MAGVSSRTITLLDLSRGRRVAIRVSYSLVSRVAVVIPAVRLAANHSYRIVVSGMTSASDGIPIRRAFALTFRTGYR